MKKIVLTSIVFLFIITGVFGKTIDIDYSFWFENSSTKCYAQLWIEGDNKLDKSWTVDNNQNNKDSNDFTYNIDDACGDCQSINCPSISCPSVSCPESSCNCPSIDLSQIPACPGNDCPSCEVDCPDLNWSGVVGDTKKNTIQDLGLGILVGIAVGIALVAVYLQSKGFNMFSLVSSKPTEPPATQTQRYNLPRSR